MRIFVTLITLWILVFSVGCQSSPVEADAPLSPTQGDTTQMPPSLPASVDANLQNLIAKAMEDLAIRLSIAADEIKLKEATEVTWPDSSLGCPSPSSMYIQVLTPGYLIRLEALNREFEYHTNKGSLVIYCESPSPPLPDTLQDR